MILVTTKENWVYMIKENEVKFLGLKDQIIAPDLIDTNVTFTPSKDTWTNQPITVEISTAITGHYLEYSTDGKNWTSYTGSIKVEENQTIYARLNNVADFHGESATYKIDWIDRVDPSGEIVTDSIEENTITVSLKNLSDTSTDTRYESSGISKIEYSINDGKTSAIETNEKSHTFSGLTGGNTYIITVKIFDQAGNSCTLTTEATTKMIKWLVKNGVVMDSSLTGYDSDIFENNAGGYAYSQSAHHSYWLNSRIILVCSGG